MRTDADTAQPRGRFDRAVAGADPLLTGLRRAVSDAPPVPSGEFSASTLIRLLWIPVVWMVGLLGRADVDALFSPACVVAMVWVVGSQLWSQRYPRRDSNFYLAYGDIVFAGLLFALSGGLHSSARHLAYVLPFATAFTNGPRRVALLGGGLLAAYTASGGHAVADGAPHALSTYLAFVVALGWATTTAAFLAASRKRRDSQITDLLATRSMLAADLVASEDRERRRLADELHDDALQLIIAASQDAGDIAAGDMDAVAPLNATLAEAVVRLRALVSEVHPLTASVGGMSASLNSVCDRLSRRGGYAWEVDVDPAADGVNDELLVGIARELIVNVSKHAHASALYVSVRLDSGWLVLTVADNGIGVAPDRRELARRDGHVGLASCAERVRVAGGNLTVESGEPGDGTTVRVVVPVDVLSVTR